MNIKTELEEQIEYLRLRLYEVFQSNTNKEDILEISQRLDELLNNYEKLR
ncbi:Spo0E family sporulation regulatory protein-aspartic acid phosphatase [Aquibacillus halophilus]|uniref:Spo0E family sporulation regulatory protein-aspartic acid phosphatase n=1 Tax=Aquibacillus halophilus TaxID=930132 RepID=A0A6A8DG21_9BACI|nr:aspartyl-phosphate phosphatase Spo0E family protein [Aquibacillus halophilus]MRH41807.1 Spo0E family sporulation regulatory protein-aspartic acid phosphatase [Aquibacillus halophilus]